MKAKVVLPLLFLSFIQLLDFGMFSRPPRSDDTNGRRHLR